MPKSNSGQSLLVILLVMVVICTICLAVFSYSNTDIKISRKEEESARAFSAAEAGIEESLRVGAATGATVGEITANVTEARQGGGEDFNFGESKVPSGELANVWLIGHTEEGALNPAVSFPYNGQIRICWGENTTLGSSTPALELALVYQQGGEYKVVRQGYDPVNSRTIGFDESLDKDGGNCGSSLAFGKDISLDGGVFNLTASDKPYLLRLKLLYNSELQPIAVQANST